MMLGYSALATPGGKNKKFTTATAAGFLLVYVRNNQVFNPLSCTPPFNLYVIMYRLFKDALMGKIILI